MSDNREEAQQELVDAGIEDALGSSLSGSFSPSPPPPKPAVEPTIAPSESAAAAEDTPEQAPIPGMAEWKDTYEAYVSHWQAESSEARSKSESTRLRIEAERAATAKSDADRVKAEKQVREKEVEEKRKEEKLKRELETSATGEGSRKRVKSESGTGKEERERKVREAWEMVKGSERKESPEEVPVDSRGVMDADIVAGQATLAGQHREEIHHSAYDPTTSSEPIPPSMRDASPSPTYPMPSESQTLSRHSATSQAWSEISASPSSAEEVSPPRSGSSSEQLPARPVSQTPAAAAGSSRQPHSHPQAHPQHTSASPGTGDAPVSHNAPPAAPPSLTLSLFTLPSSLSVSRVIAVLGINLVLPFINGVMLGFGEIFAREVVRVGKLVYRGERGLFGWRRRGGSDDFAGGRGVTSVGLSGSGGFP